MKAFRISRNGRKGTAFRIEISAAEYEAVLAAWDGTPNDFETIDIWDPTVDVLEQVFLREDAPLMAEIGKLRERFTRQGVCPD